MSQKVSSQTPAGPQCFDAIVPGVAQTVAAGASSAQSAAFGADTQIVRVIASVDCFIAFGLNPTASTSGIFIAAKVPEYFGVTAGQKVAAIQSASAGSLYVTEGA